jgi:hypothetical protein
MAQFTLISPNPVTVQIVFEPLEMKALQDKVETMNRMLHPKEPFTIVSFLQGEVFHSVKLLVDAFKQRTKEDLTQRFYQASPEKQAEILAMLDTELAPDPIEPIKDTR